MPRVTMQDLIVIKKYHNRRLYNCSSSSYVNLNEIKELIHNGLNFIVIDAKTGKDLTRLTIIQIILELETKGYNLLPITLLKQLVLSHEQASSEIYYSFLEELTKNFSRSQQEWYTKFWQTWTKQKD